jgi:nitroreductase
MDTLKTIKDRYSYRGKYQKAAVPREDLQKILEAGLSAPSGCNKRPSYKPFEERAWFNGFGKKL